MSNKIENIKKANKKFKFTKIYFFTTIFMLILASFYLSKQLNSLKSYENKIIQINKEIENEEKLNNQLKNQKEYKNSNENIEKIAREKLGMVKSNEIIFYDTNK